MVVSNRNLLFQGSIFRCYVSFRESNYPNVVRRSFWWEAEQLNVVANLLRKRREKASSTAQKWAGILGGLPQLSSKFSYIYLFLWFLCIYFFMFIWIWECLVFNMYSLPHLKKDLKLSSYHESISVSSGVTEFLFHLFTCLPRKKMRCRPRSCVTHKKKRITTLRMVGKLPIPYTHWEGDGERERYPSMYDIIYFPRFLVDFDGNFM